MRSDRDEARGGHRAGVGEVDHEAAHYRERHGDADVDRVGVDRPLRQAQPDGLGLREAAFTEAEPVPQQFHHEQGERHPEHVGKAQRQSTDRASRQLGQGHDTDQDRGATSGGDIGEDPPRRRSSPSLPAGCSQERRQRPHPPSQRPRCQQQNQGCLSQHPRCSTWTPIRPARSTPVGRYIEPAGVPCRTVPPP